MIRPSEPTCIGCGCTESRACLGPDGLPCYWVSLDEETNRGLCSTCALKPLEELLDEGPRARAATA